MKFTFFIIMCKCLAFSSYSLFIGHVLNTNRLMSLMKNSILEYISYDPRILDGWMEYKVDLWKATFYHK